VGITSDSATGPGAFDGGGDSYSEQALTAAALAPGATVYQDGTTLTWPDVPAGQPDNVITQGQTIDVSGHGSALVLLGASNNGTGTGREDVDSASGPASPLSALLPWVWAGAGVASGAWVPA
jgi:beta-glucosidase